MLEKLSSFALAEVNPVRLAERLRGHGTCCACGVQRNVLRQSGSSLERSDASGRSSDRIPVAARASGVRPRSRGVQPHGAHWEAHTEGLETE